MRSPGGGARRAASYGARVAIAEAVRVAGTCVLRGCVPKKLLVYGTHFADEIEDAAGYGWSFGDCNFDWPSLIANQVNIEHPDIDRVPACDIRDDTDLGTRRVTRHVPPLTLGQIMTALQRGLAYAQGLQRRGLIHAAWLVCQQQSVSCGREARLSPAQIGVTSP